MSYKVYTANEVIEVKSLKDAYDIVSSEWNESGEPDGSGFVNPWIEDEEGNEIPYTPSQDEVKAWLD